MSFLDFFRRPPTPAKYARLLINKLAIHAPDETVRFDEAGFRLLLGADGKQVINLHNLYREYCALDKHERVLQLHRSLALLRPATIPSDFAQARSRLMPVLRARGMLEYLRLMELDQDAGEPPGSLALPFSSDAALMLVHDGADTMQSFGPAQLAQWGVTAEQALAAAMDNLRDASVEHFTQPVRGVFAGAWDDAYDSSRLLLSDLAHRVAGASPLAMVPARGTLLLASGTDRAAVGAMVALAQQIAENDTRPVSALLYRLDGGRPVEYLPEDVGIRAALARLERYYRHGDYAAQKDTLDQLHDKHGTDIFVATCQLMRDEASGLEYSICSWTEGVDTLLPRTDRVALVVLDGDQQLKEHLVVAWDVLHAACGQLMAPLTDAYPERYRVTGFPDLALARTLALA